MFVEVRTLEMTELWLGKDPVSHQHHFNFFGIYNVAFLEIKCLDEQSSLAELSAVAGPWKFWQS